MIVYSTWEGHRLFYVPKLAVGISAFMAIGHAAEKLSGFNLGGVVGGLIGVLLCCIPICRFFDRLSAWCYCRLILGVAFRWSELGSFYWMFVPNSTGKWYPMTHVLKMPREQRKVAILFEVFNHHANRIDK